MTRPDTPPVRIVAVHGVGNGFGADITNARREELRQHKAAAWTRYLADGLGTTAERIDLAFAYSADRLATGPARQGAGEGEFLHDPLAQQMLDAWAQEFGLPEEVSHGRA